MNVYFISGIATDCSPFRDIRLPSPFKIHHLDWIKPTKHETLEHYAHRLAAPIDVSKPFALVGLSFGGMVAIEMNKFLTPHHTIIISSVSERWQLPFYYRLAGMLHLERLLPDIRFAIPNPFLDFILGIKRTDQERRLIKDIGQKISMNLLRWSLGHATRWRNDVVPKNLFHIHGSQDRVFPIKRVKADMLIDGGHVMIFTHAKQISELITKRLSG